ncbi:hypothetical protein JHK85_031093 [Glycine max]|nr:hypothetical protein JHK85_031093 [Glycine max]
MNGNMRQPSDEVPPPFTSTAKGSNSLIPAAMGINDDLQTKDLEEGYFREINTICCKE